MINSPAKQVSKNYDSLIKKFELGSLKKEFNLNLSSPSLQLLQSSNKKFFFEQENFNNNNENTNEEKNIKQKLEEEFNNINNVKEKRESCPIVFTVNDKFLDLLINIYSGNDISSEDISNINNSINSLNELENNSNIIKNNYENNEQISCICLKSNCNNNYCSCHKNNNFCNDNCRCLNCKNKSGTNDISLSTRNKNEKIKNFCKCKNTKCSSLYCDCKNNSILCSKKCLCVNCENI